MAARFVDLTVVQAVLFYSPNCGHCHYVVTELLQPMMTHYADQLEILGIDISQQAGSDLYHAAIDRYGIPSGRRGVPTLIAGDVVLVGSAEIPEQFPDLVAEGLATGGIPWPDIPGLADLLTHAQSQPSPTAAPQATAPAPSASETASLATSSPDPSPTPAAAAILDSGQGNVPHPGGSDPSPDPLGFSLAGVVLAGMAFSFGFACWRFCRPGNRQRLVRLLTSNRPAALGTSLRMVPLLALVGLGVASYLAYVEITHVAAVCGPVGECNVVQTSDYALFLGLPVAVWGVLFYVTVLALWAGHRYLGERWAGLSLLALLGLTLFGVVFSTYLTCLELFVIRAICSWCLSSAVITTALMLLAANAIKGREHAYPRRRGTHAKKRPRSRR
jgi:uncharacterized membrane protein